MGGIFLLAWSDLYRIEVYQRTRRFKSVKYGPHILLIHQGLNSRRSRVLRKSLVKRGKKSIYSISKTQTFVNLLLLESNCVPHEGCSFRCDTIVRSSCFKDPCLCDWIVTTAVIYVSEIENTERKTEKTTARDDNFLENCKKQTKHFRSIFLYWKYSVWNVAIYFNKVIKLSVLIITGPD